MNATEWLENYLIKFKDGADHLPTDILDRVVNRIVEIVGGKAEFYGGNYSFYVAEKEPAIRSSSSATNGSRRRLSGLRRLPTGSTSGEPAIRS